MIELNPAVRDFFENTYTKWTNSFREEAISPVLNKCRPFLTDARMRAVIGPAHSTFRFRSLMDEGKILLCDLSKGAIGQDNAQLLGSLIAMQEKLAALSRYDLPEEQRVSHVLYVEEALRRSQLDRAYPGKAEDFYFKQDQIILFDVLRTALILD
jgi:hypothetical protein